MRALITGAGGQDGRLLARRLRSQGVEVFGLHRAPLAVDLPSGTQGIRGDVTDESTVHSIVGELKPDQIYHLAACHHSSEQSGNAALDRQMVATNFRSTEMLLAAILQHRPACRLLYAGSSQMYRPQPGERRLVDEATPMDPGSFYGLTKSWARQLLAHYRDHRGVFCGTAILFNHESPLRPAHFVTRKITSAAARAARGEPAALHLRDISSETDWSSASDVVEAMFLALCADSPSDYVVASGSVHTVEDVLRIAFQSVKLDWRAFTTYDRPVRRSGTLVGDSTRARSDLRWTPSHPFDSMIEEMVAFDLAGREPADVLQPDPLPT